MDNHLERVKKLLARSADQCNAHESEIALRLATNMMARYGIDASVLEVSETGDLTLGEIGTHVIFQSRRVPAWKVELACALAEANCCQAAVAPGFGVFVYGYKKHWDTVRELWAVVMPQVDAWAKKQKGEGHGYVRSYRLGMVDTIQRLLTEEKQSVIAEKQASENETSLAVINQIVASEKRSLEDVTDFMSDQVSGTPWQAGGSHNRAGYLAGVRDGEKVGVT